MSSDVLYALPSLPEHTYISLSHTISEQSQSRHKTIRLVHTPDTQTYKYTHQTLFQHQINRPIRWWLTTQRKPIFLPGWLFLFWMCYFLVHTDLNEFSWKVISTCQMLLGSQMYEHHIEDVTSGEMRAVQHIELRICFSFQVSSVMWFT